MVRKSFFHKACLKQFVPYALSVTASIVLAANSYAKPPTPQNMVSSKTVSEYCRRAALPKPTQIDDAFCSAYVRGVMDAYSLLAVSNPGGEVKEYPICLDSGVSGSQLRDVFLKYVALYPEKQHFPAILLMWSSWSIAFPCQQN